MTTVRLEDLISAVTSAHQDPLERLERAVDLGSHLDEVADRLIGHFVEQARRSGASWTAIGSSLGVSKQAVQKRFSTKGASPLDPSQGFSRFTEQARSAVVVAQEEARSAGNDRITVAHLLLGMVRDPTCSAATLLAGQGVDLDAVRRTARATLPVGVDDVPALVPFDPHARDALERTFTEAGRLGQDQIGTEHLLLAVLAVEDGTGVLAGLGVDAGRVAQELGERPH
jgi:hypothetical protein